MRIDQLLTGPPDRRAQALRICAIAVLVVALGWEAARALWLLWPQPEPTLPPERLAAAPEQASADDPMALARRIAEAALFGRATSDSASPQPVVDAPPTTLDLTLQGILHDSRAAGRRALIVAGGRTEVYAEGESVGTGTTIDTIHADRVILNRNGRRETLRLPEKALDAMASPPPQDPARRGAPNRAASASDIPPPSGDIRQAIIADPGLIAQYLQATPEMGEDGQMRGFRIAPGNDPALLDATGLEPNDVLLEVAGTPMTSQSAVMEVLQGLGSARQVTLVVERDGQRRRLMIDLSERTRN